MEGGRGDFSRPLGKLRPPPRNTSYHLLVVATYPAQQLPGVPHELGVPQQLPEPGSNPCGEWLDVL